MVEEGASVAETHSGVVLFVGDRAYKMKKPVDLGFLDFTSLASRRLACEREVELNRRLAPDVYLGAGAIVGADGEVQEHLVLMRRLPADRRLRTLVEQGAPGLERLVREVGTVLGRFHREADRSPSIDQAAGPAAVRERWQAELDGVRPFVGDVLDAGVAARIDALAAAYLDGREALFRRRVEQGRACDGHGDLLADDIFCLDDGPRILDCLDFDDRLRWDDALADVCFLAMDLDRLGRADLAWLLLEVHRELTDDDWPASLARHHMAYRAHVRAKVACIRHAQGDPSSAGSARHHLDLAAAHLEAGRVRMVLVGGLPGTGKTTVASAVASDLGAVHLRTDEIRKELAGIDSHTSAAAPFGAGLYAPEAVARTYDELVRRAAEQIGLGRSVVLDASWQDRGSRRRALEVAATGLAELTMLRCVAPAPLSRRRVRERLDGGRDASDATPEVADAMAERFDAWPDAVIVDTSGPLERSLDLAREGLGVQSRRP